MYSKINYSPYYYLNSRHLNLLDFGLKIGGKTRKEKLFKIGENQNRLLYFVELTFNYAKWIFPKYSCDYSNHIYNQPQLFTILAMKTYLKTTYREIIEILDVSDKITTYLKLNKLPHYTTIQKFFIRMSDTKLKDLNNLILFIHPIDCELAAMDGTGHTSDYADHYYAKIRGKCRKSYIKNHIAIDVDTRMILNYAANRGPKYDTQFAIASIRQLKPYKPHYILADRAYDTEAIRKCINEEVGAFDQIPLKTRAKTGHYRLNSATIFWHDVYARRMNVESVIYVIKRRFNGGNYSRSTKLQNKETKLKDVLYNIYRAIQVF